LHVPRGKIDVVPQGVRQDPPSAALSTADTRARFGIGARRVILALSAKRPHKNLRALIGALARLEPAERPLLVLPGYPTAHEHELRAQAQASGIADDVLILGWLADDEIEGLWRVAEAFVYPSLYEGFGLPVLEAMARGVPVACSNASSLPEVAGDAALLFDPHDEAAIAAAIRRLIGDPQLAAALRAGGLERVRKFSWEQTAAATLGTYARALDRERLDGTAEEPSR
jgi:glycosyltransferase involved in cell wall biosynthesis